jgi:hypothetical protein
MARSAAKVGHVAQQALGGLGGGGSGQAAGAATEQVGQAASAAVQQVGQAAAKATEQVGEAAVEVRGKASWTPSKEEGAGQQRRSASRRSREGEPKRGTRRSRSSGGDGK